MKTATATNIKQGEIYRLPRGGYLVDTTEGYVQVGSPPETIKDTMAFPSGVPQIFCLPTKFFNRSKAISVAEVEFPIYFNFFIMKRKAIIVCLKKHKKIFERVISEALFGPETLDLRQDYVKSMHAYIPDLKKEMDFFVAFKAEDVVEFRTLEKDKGISIGNCAISLNANEEYEIHDRKAKTKVMVPGEITYNVIYDIGNVPQEPFKPPYLGVTCLGPSHGFDPKDNTSGFIIWINGMGIMVDPPVNSTEWLRRSNVNPRLIDSIILTHTHADHDTGTFQKILEEYKIDIYTTRTVMNSWVYKYSTLSDIPEAELRSLFNYKEVKVGKSINIKGAWFSFRYMLHSIPTMGFRFQFRNKSFVYSSDHLHLPKTFDLLLEKNIIDKHRHEEFNNFPWDSDLIYHESGMPPLHTPVSYLDSLPPSVKKKMIIYHIAAKDFPEESLLTLAKFGIANTVSLNVEKGTFEEMYLLLETISKIEIFKDFSLNRVKDLISVLQKHYFSKNTRVIKKDSKGDFFYLVVSGSLVIRDQQGTVVKRYGRYQYLGEVSLLLNTNRTADVYAESDVEVLSLSKDAFKNIVDGTELEQTLLQVAQNRDMQSWEALSNTKIFQKLTSAQKTDLEIIMQRLEVTKDSKLFEDSKPVKEIYIYHSGPVEGFQRKSSQRIKYSIGDIIGNYDEFKSGKRSTLICQAKKNSLVFKIVKASFDKFLEKNPGVSLRILEMVT